MVTRIVKMSFRTECTQDFQNIFEKYKEQIRAANIATREINWKCIFHIQQMG